MQLTDTCASCRRRCCRRSCVCFALIVPDGNGNDSFARKLLAPVALSLSLFLSAATNENEKTITLTTHERLIVSALT